MRWHCPGRAIDWPGDVRVTRVRAVELRMIGLPLVRPFRTSFGTSTEKMCVLVRVETDDAEGWGECVADIEPGFSEEFNDGAWLVLREFLVPALLAAGDVSTDDLDRVFAFVRGNPMAKATLIDACRRRGTAGTSGTSLASWLGAERERVECGVSVGMLRHDRRAARSGGGLPRRRAIAGSS